MKFQNLFFLSAAAAGLTGLMASAGCGDSGTSGGVCQCTGDDECEDGTHCENCSCVPDCTGSADCPADRPNCDTDTGRCVGPCSEPAHCTDPNFPNCNAAGVCVGPCSSHADCTHPDLPNCSLDPNMDDYGVCGPPCASNADCQSPLYPNCHPTSGTCGPPCDGDGDCPDGGWKCDLENGICFMPECEQDGDCNPPDTVCEDWICVPGCTSHGDCAPDARCDLVTPGHMNHCEPRDCLEDADCNPPDTVCDSDGLADPDGGGYCQPGCATYLDCGQAGYACNPAAGRCEPMDYGDIGQACSGGCESDFCLSGMGNICTAFCCRQNDCPPGWGCRPYDDGTGDGHTVRVCLPLDAQQGLGRPGASCVDPQECRSNICFGGQCRETCCTHTECDDPYFSGLDCRLFNETSACIPEATEGNDPVGALGCATSGTPSDCRSDMCFTYFTPDTDCSGDGDCTTSRPTCWDYPGAGDAGVNDCVKDICVGLCCSATDCPDYNGDRFFCGKWVFGSGDFNLCLLHEGGGTAAAGQACSQNGDCRSNFCASGTVCRRRCCSDQDCPDPTRPRCGLEEHTVHGVTRWLNVCLP